MLCEIDTGTDCSLNAVHTSTHACCKVYLLTNTQRDQLSIIHLNTTINIYLQ